MKIEILDAADPLHAASFVLFNGALESPEDPLEAGHEDLVQVAPGIRAAASKVFNRKNTVFTLPLQWTKDYGSVKAAELALLDFPGTVPRAGIIKITPENSAGDGDLRYIRNACIHRFTPRQIGQAIIWKFLITGGSISNTAPS